jgi:hypothetical protein
MDCGSVGATSLVCVVSPPCGGQAYCVGHLRVSGALQEGQIWPGVKFRRMPPGRAQWVDRSGVARVVQLAYDPEQ